MNTEGTTISLEHLLRTYADVRSQQLHVAIPGRIESYDRQRQTVAVQPLIMMRRVVEGGHELEEVPQLPSVPVLFPRGGGAFITWPLEKGDHVMLVFQDRSIDRWLHTDGRVTDPVDPRSHSICDAVAIPGFHPFPKALAPERQSNDILLGFEDGDCELRIQKDVVQVGGGADFIALAAKVDAALDEIRQLFNSHVHVASGTPTGTPQAVDPDTGAPSPSPIPSHGSVAAEKAKAT